MIEAVIFDMDGLLIDSEPLWQRAEIEIFGKLGLDLTVEMCEKLQGQKIEQVAQHWYNYKPWTGKSFKEIEKEMVARVEQLIMEHVPKMAGVDYLLDFFEKRNLKIGLASASNLSLIEIALNKIEIRNRFTVIHSAQFEKLGKPAPDVYLSAAKMLGAKPENCLVFEDSYNGVCAGKAAGMKVVAVPAKSQWHESKYDIADLKLRSLEEFTEVEFNMFQSIDL